MFRFMKIVPVATALVLFAGCLDPDASGVAEGAAGAESDVRAGHEPEPEPDTSVASIPAEAWCERTVTQQGETESWHRIWDTQGRLVRLVRTAPTVRVYETSYDAGGRVVRFEYFDGEGAAPVSTIDHWYREGGAVESRHCNPHYDGGEQERRCRRAWRQVRPDGQDALGVASGFVSEYLYDEQGRLIYSSVSRSTDWLFETYSSYDEGTGLLADTARYLNGQAIEVESYLYDEAGRLVRKETHAPSAEHEPVGRLLGEMTLSYDAAGRLSRVEADGRGEHQDLITGSLEADGETDLVVDYGYACAEPRVGAVETPPTTIDHTQQVAAYGEEVLVPAGSFYYGHPGVLRELGAFFIDVTEVDVLTYQACVEAGACTLPAFAGVQPFGTYLFLGRAHHPVNYVTIEQAEDVCAWVGKRLCSDAEWSKAARGGCEIHGEDCSATADWLTLPAEVLDAHPSDVGLGDTRPIGSPGALSPYGVANMVGNVREWARGESDLPVIRGEDFDLGLSPDTGGGVLGRSLGEGAEAQETVGVRCCRDAD